MKIRFLKLIDRIVGVMATAVLPHASMRSFPTIRRFLIIRPGGIGDAVLLIPAIMALKEKYPEARITVLAEKRNGAIFKLCPVIHNVLCYDRPKEFITAIRGQYDVVIDTEQWHRLSAMVARLVGAPLKIGFATNERQKFFTHPVAYSNDDYELDSFLHLLGPLGGPTDTAEQSSFLILPAAALNRADEQLTVLGGDPFVVIFPGASIAERRWGADRFSMVAEKIQNLSIPLVVVGSDEDASDAKKIIAGKYGLNLAGKTSLVETAAVIKKSSLLVSGDSGILHIGVGLGKPTVSLFGPGIARKWAPRGDRHIVINKCLPCSPCTKFGYTPNCPINVKCLADITPDEVSAAINKLFLRCDIMRRKSQR